MSSAPNPIPDSAPVTVVVHRLVKAGMEGEFETWLAGVTHATTLFAGHLGTEIFRPAPGEREYVVVYRFDTHQNLRRWTDSRVRAEWVAKADRVSEEPHLQVLTGLEHWFTMPSRLAPGAPPPPPRWKMAVITWLAIFPLINLMNFATAPFLGGVAAPLRVLVTSLLLVPLMTWVVMPGITRIFVRWIFPAR